MVSLRKYKKLLNYSGAAVVFIGSGWITYHIYTTRLKPAFGTTLLRPHKTKPEYIYITDPKLKDDINLFASKCSEKDVDQILPWKWLESWRQSLAWRLLSVAKTGDKYERLKAVRTLASLKDLKDSDFCNIAQSCDARTAVGLARSDGADLKYFLKSVYINLYHNKQDVIDRLKQLLISLDNKSNHHCLRYLMAKTLPEYQRQDRIFDPEMSSIEPSHTVLKDDELIHICVQNLLHHSAIEDNAKDIVSEGALPLLIGVYRHFLNDREVVIALAKLLSNISFYKEHLNDIFQTGWIGILAQWSRDPDIQISSPAVKALYNLDEEFEDGRFPRSIYVLHPTVRTMHVPKIDVVFIHGLWGGLFVTWRQRDTEQKKHVLKAVRSTTTVRPFWLVLQSQLSQSSRLLPLQLLKTLLPLFRNHMFVWLLNRYPFIVVVPTVWLSVSLRHASLPTNVVDRNTSPLNSSHSISDEKTRAFLEEVTELKQEEWNEIGNDFEIVMEDCPLSTNITACGPYSFTGEKCPECHEDIYTPCWPRDWLPKDCPYLRIVGVNYDTTISRWSPTCPSEKIKCTLDDRSEEIMEKLKLAGVGQRPVIWVTHSMGGLLVKKILVRAWESGDRNICYKTKGIAFYSVPHLGSPLAELTQAMQILLWPSVEVQELRKDSPELKSLHQKFLQMLPHLQIQIISFAETKSTLVSPLRLQFHFVPVPSADPGVGEIFEIPQDHLCICKPATQHSFLYQKLVDLTKKVDQTYCTIMDY
ncbi:protein SERAC1 isoform X2 [Schistocerca gregaria]|uniref:protein SERAC1 isoform X2 n=1 Tax=Schistocerca gregaria TaxID=7010 RepID=UPI00211E76C8|nr:protein SERAC1 isoform X2 [Schistocerca gregaria]